MASRVWWVPGEGEDPFAKEPEDPYKPTAEEVAQAFAALPNVEEEKKKRRSTGILKAIVKSFKEEERDLEAFVQALPIYRQHQLTLACAAVGGISRKTMNLWTKLGYQGVLKEIYLPNEREIERKKQEGAARESHRETGETSKEEGEQSEPRRATEEEKGKRQEIPPSVEGPTDIPSTADVNGSPLEIEEAKLKALLEDLATKHIQQGGIPPMTVTQTAEQKEEVAELFSPDAMADNFQDRPQVVSAGGVLAVSLGEEAIDFAQACWLQDQGAFCPWKPGVDGEKEYRLCEAGIWASLGETIRNAPTLDAFNAGQDAAAAARVYAAADTWAKPNTMVWYSPTIPFDIHGTNIY